MPQEQGAGRHERADDGEGTRREVLAVGRPEVKAAARTAPQYGKIGFVLVGDGGTAGNVTTVRTGDGLRANVAAAVERAVNEGS